jgi:hypothetical protein
MNYIYLYNKLLNEKITKIVELSKIKNINSECSICKKKFNNTFKFKNLLINESSIHELADHNIIEYEIYEKISLIELTSYDINYFLFNTNSINIIDGLYEEGSNKIYIENNKNIFNSQIQRFSEHYGFIYFLNNKLDKIVILPDGRVDKEDPLIYLPKNSIEAFNVDYIFHTHPKTPYIGSRIKNSIIYEFPSISDISHFIEHHNKGKLLGSLVITPEGIYTIRKFIFNRDKIKIDYDIFVTELENMYMECYEDSIIEYNDLLTNKIKKIDDEYEIPNNIFYNKIANNLKYIRNINWVLEKYDVTIDFYKRSLINDKWVFPSIYIPNII